MTTKCTSHNPKIPEPDKCYVIPKADVALPKIFRLPWTLRFEEDGTEDIAVICQSTEFGSPVLAVSRQFWLPRYGGEEICGTLAAMQLMVSAPKLLEALQLLFAQTANVHTNRKLRKALNMARSKARTAIAGAMYSEDQLKSGYDEYSRTFHRTYQAALKIDSLAQYASKEPESSPKEPEVLEVESTRLADTAVSSQEQADTANEGQ
jgi:hypothetical protein